MDALIVTAMLALAALAVLAILVVWFVKVIIWLATKLGGGRADAASISCPHCSAETPANLDKCRQCGWELR